MIASIWGNLEIVKYLVENGANVNDGLSVASAKGHLEIVKYLVENGADVNVVDNENKTALDCAKNDEIKAFLVKARIKKLQYNFIEYAKQGNKNKIQECLANNISVDMVDSDGKTALMWACQKGHLEIVLILVAGGANLSAKSKNGKTALNYAVESGNMELIKLLLAQGADTGAKG